MLRLLICSLLLISRTSEGEKKLKRSDHKPSNNAFKECVPTSVVQGDCHTCVCNEDGTYLCVPVDGCEPSKIKKLKLKKTKECEPHVLYRENILWCRCDENGFWKSENCRGNYRQLSIKTDLRDQALIPDNACDNNSYYVVDCNICICKDGQFNGDYCSKRQCSKGSKADDCKVGDFLRLDGQLCACSKQGIYVDKLCIKVSNASASKLKEGELTMLLGEYADQRLDKKCVPNSKMQKDCNECTCSENGVMVCTTKKCTASPQATESGESKKRASETESEKAKTEVTTAVSTSTTEMPTLESEKDKCTPGQQYKVKCNTCYCTKNGVLSCTSMLCLDDAAEKETRPPSSAVKFQSAAVTLTPEHKEGDNCTVGKVYKIDCNICKCSPSQRMICTKKVCLNEEQQAMLNEVETFKFRSSKQRDRELKSKLRGGKKNKNKNKKKNKKNKGLSEKSSEDADEAKNASSKALKGKEYPPLPLNKKCQPGEIYKRGCQRCFCNEMGKPHCTSKSCEDMKGPVRVPEDVRSSIPKIAFDKLPTLANEAQPCQPGVAYRIECNSCLCLKNKILLCGNMLCLSPLQMNRIQARKESGKPCDESYQTPPDHDCIECHCKKGIVRCHAKPDCEPPTMRRALHGDFPAKLEAYNLKPDSSKCVPGLVYREKCNFCYCQPEGSLRCTRKGCLNYQQAEKLKKHRVTLMARDDPDTDS